jgi:4-amino-4-deoxy-L-arabinose transferase-like glycosyltransferase
MVSRRPSWPSLVLLAIVLLAAFLRFWRLEQLPPGLYHDEAYYGLDALSLLRGETFPRFYEGWELYANDAHAERPAAPTRFPVFFEGNYGREPLHVYLMALSIRLFGNTPFAARVVSAAAGTLAVLTTWLAARALFPPDEARPGRGELLPLLAAFTLAVLYPALHFSRFGIRAMTLLPPMTLAVWAFWRGWRSGSAAWLGLAGFFVGLTLYTFAAGRLFPFVFVLFGGYLLLTDWAGLRRQWRGLAAATAVAVLTAAPLLLYFIRYPYFFVFRMAYVANRGEGAVAGAPALTWLLNVGRVVGGFFWRGEIHLRHNLPGRPFLDPAQAALLIVGVAQSVRRWRWPEYAFTLLWLGVMCLPSILSGDAPHFGRLIGAAPAAAVLVAVGLTWLVERLDQAARPRWVAPAVVVGLCAFSLALTARDYFGRYAAQPDLARDFYLADWELGRFAASRPADTTLYLSPSQEEMATIYFALGDPDRLRSFNGETGLISAGIPDQPSLYLIRPAAASTLANLQEYFPEGVTGAAGDNFIPFEAPADAARMRLANPATADFGDVIRLVGHETARDGDNLTVSLAWQATTAPLLDYTAFVHVLDAAGTLIAQTDRPPAGYPTGDWRPGEIVIDHFVVELPAGLPPGIYRLQTGFYDPATVARLGEPADLGTVVLP